MLSWFYSAFFRCASTSGLLGLLPSGHERTAAERFRERMVHPRMHLFDVCLQPHSSHVSDVVSVGRQGGVRALMDALKFSSLVFDTVPTLLSISCGANMSKEYVPGWRAFRPA